MALAATQQTNFIPSSYSLQMVRKCKNAENSLISSHFRHYFRLGYCIKNVVLIDQACGFRVIIMTQANSQVNTQCH